MMRKSDAEWLHSCLCPDEMNLSEKDSVRFNDLLESFVSLIREKGLNVATPMLEDVRGYISYCLADESSFADPSDYANAKIEASKWIAA